MFDPRYNTGDLQQNIPKAVDIPIELYESVKGKYFIGYADHLTFGKGTAAWARLYNPPNSGVNLHVNVWTVTAMTNSTFRAQFWFNADIPGNYTESELVTPSNTAFRPIPVPKVKLQLASNATEKPVGGIKAYVRRGEPHTTVVENENGKLIFPPNGTFLVYMNVYNDNPEEIAEGRIAFGWWEEPIVYRPFRR